MNLHTSNIDKKNVMKYLNMVVDDGFLNEGKYVDLFREKLIDRFKLINPVLVNSY